jgi:hypothetical protein
VEDDQSLACGQIGGSVAGRIARKARALLVLSVPLLLTLVVQNVRANNRATSATPASAVDPAAAHVAAATFAADYLSYTDRMGTHPHADTDHSRSTAPYPEAAAHPRSRPTEGV